MSTLSNNINLFRDWRGLAYLVNVSSEKAAYIQLRPHKTAEVLEIWQKDPSATVGHLLNHLERLDRYDVYDDLYDDLREAIKRKELLGKLSNSIIRFITNFGKPAHFCPL